MSEPTTTPVITSTQITNNPDSSFFGISIRAWLAIILVCTVCFCHTAIVVAVMIEAIMSRDFAKVGTFTTISEPLYTLVIGAVAYYFGQKK